jgi:hypothetical protein
VTHNRASLRGNYSLHNIDFTPKSLAKQSSRPIGIPDFDRRITGGVGHNSDNLANFDSNILNDLIFTALEEFGEAQDGRHFGHEFTIAGE